MIELLENEFQMAISKQPNNLELLFRYNEFRIANASVLPRSRPQILVGSPFGVMYPNLHTAPLFALADVISLTYSKQPYSYYSSIHCEQNTLFIDILKKLPKGFKPDFYWDNQVEHKHYVPPGLEMAPFPIIASVSHFYLQKSIEHVCELFDKIIPISKFYGKILSKKYPEKVLNFPFGLNWASFDHLIVPSFEKTIDVAVTFSETDFPYYHNYRNQVLALVKEFKEKYGKRFKIEVQSKLTPNDYIELLRKSRITLNVTGINGPYNYRTIEAMCTGSLIFQYDYEGDFFENSFDELFISDKHGVTFNLQNFESKLLYYLENQEITKQIATDAYQFLKENYSYKKLYKDLIESVKDIKILRTPYPNHNSDMIYYNQPGNMVNRMNFGVIDQGNITPWIRFNNLMILSYLYPSNTLGNIYLILSSKELQELKTIDSGELCFKYYELAKSKSEKQFVWIIEWNFLLLKIENNKAIKDDAVTLYNQIIDVEVSPFDENLCMFKYYITKNTYARYTEGGKSEEFYNLNMELVKVIDQPKKRAELYQKFVIDALIYFSEVLPK